MDKVSGEEIEKTSSRTERVSSSITYQELYKKLGDIKKIYLMHRYQVNNDVFHWPMILATTITHGSIYHIDYSENLSQIYKYVPESSNFIKRQFSLHCTVKHSDENQRCYLYHLSSNMKHDFAFTFTGTYQLYEKVVCDLLILL